RCGSCAPRDFGCRRGIHSRLRDRRSAPGGTKTERPIGVKPGQFWAWRQAMNLEETAGAAAPQRDERVRQGAAWRRLMSRPELGAVAGTILVFLFFAILAGDSGMFSARGMLNFLEVSAQLGILAALAALLMIGGEFDLSVGSLVAFAGIVIAIPS